LKARRKAFDYQRALMGGGTCEATAYQEFGLQTAAVCIALGNYHNCADHNRIKAEYVNIADACGMVDLLAAGAKQMPNYEKLTDKLPKLLAKLGRESEAKLRRTA
jgi:putative aminopeptidase FrvX